MKKLLLFLLLTFYSINLAQNVGDIRSRQNGNWNAVTTWQVCTQVTPSIVWEDLISGIPGYSPTNPTSYPTSSVTITHTVTIPKGSTMGNGSVINLSFGDLNINGPGNLTINPNNGTTVNFLTTYTVNITNGTMNLNANQLKVKFPQNAQIIVQVGGGLCSNSGGVSGLGIIGGTCSNQVELYIGEVLYSTCTGNGGAPFGGNFCDVNNSGGSVNATATPNSLCLGGTVNLSTQSYTGATYLWSLLSGPGGYTFPTTGVNVRNLSLNLSLAGTYVFEVKVTRNGASVFDPVTVVVNQNSSIALSSASNTNNQTACIGQPISNITYNVDNATGATVTGLPPGVSGSYSAGVFTISGSPTGTGTYNYTVTSQGCGNSNATGTITVNTLDYANLQYPSSGAICQGGAFTAYGQVYEPGITPGAGSQGAGITVEFGYSNVNTNPVTWSNWSAASFNSLGGGNNNDEYQYTFNPPSPGTYYYTFRYRLGNCSWQFGGYSASGGGFWDGSNNLSGILTVSATPVGGTASAAQTICAGTAPAGLTLSGSSGSIQWQSSPDNITFNNIPGQTGNTLNPGALNVTTYYRAVLNNGICTSAFSNVIMITVTQSPTYGNLQFPATGIICQTDSFDIYGRVYQAGITETAGPGSGITAQFGYHTANTNPSTWSNWSNAAFNVQAGNDDEFKYTFNPPAAGTYYYTFRYRQGNCNWVYGGYSSTGGGLWDGSANVSGVLTVNPNIPASVSISSDSGTSICAGSNVIFTAIPTNGGSPSYQWKVNGIDVGGNISTYSSNTLNQGDAVTVVMTSNGIACVTGSPVTSNTLTMTVGATSTFTAGGWSSGLPNNNGLNAVIAANYDTAAGNITACNCTVNTGATLTISSNSYMEVLNDVNNNGSIIVKSDGNLKQVNKNASNTGEIKVRRFFTWSGDRKEYNFLSSPVVLAAPFTMKHIFGNNAANVPAVTVLREPTNSFVNAVPSDYTIPAKGFALREARTTYAGVPAESIANNEAQFKGKPNNGDIILPLSYTPGRGYNLSGNPYPSNMDIIDLYNNSTSALIDPTFRFWDNSINDIYVQQGGAYQGYSYALFNAETDTDGYGIAAPGNGVGGPAGNKVPNRIIKVSQGFMIRATSNGAQLVFNNSMRKTTNTDVVFYGRQLTQDRFRLQLVREDGFTLQNGISYFAAGNQTIGREDTRIPNASASDALFTYAGEAKVVINGRSSFTPDDVVTLGTRHYTSGTYTLQAVDEEGVFGNGQAIYLKDKKLGIITDLSKGDYVFASEAGEYTDRFEIVYAPALVLATDTTVKGQIEIYRDASDFVIRSSDQVISSVEVYDVSGRLIVSAAGRERVLRFSAERLQEGMYVVKAHLKDGKQITKKIRK